LGTAAALASALHLLLRLRSRLASLGALTLLGLSSVMLFYVLQIGAENLIIKDWFNRLQIFGIMLTPVVWMLFILRFAGFADWVNRRLVFGLSLLPVILGVLAMTNELHHLVITSTSLATGQGGSVVLYTLGSFSILYILYLILVLGASLLPLLRLSLEARPFYQKQAIVLLAGPASGVMAIFMLTSNLNPIAPYSPLPYIFAIDSFLAAWGVFHLKVGDILPVTRGRVFDELLDGVVIIDRHKRVVELNLAAAKLLHLDPDIQPGSELRAIAPSLAVQIDLSTALEGKDQSVELGSGMRLHQFNARTSFWLDPEGQLTSCQIWLRDITDLKKVEDSLRMALKETETLRQAGLALAAELDMDQILERVLRYVHQAVPYDRAQVLMEEDGAVRVRALFGLTLPSNEEGLARRLKNYLLIQQMHKLPETICVPVVMEDHPYASLLPADARSFLAVPLMMSQRFIGCLVLESYKLGRFGSAEQLLVEAFAGQASISIQNAFLFQKVREQAITDPLTGVYNRRYFMEVVNREIGVARQQERMLSMVLIDLDHFKQVNDTYGHVAGDQVLVRVSQTARCQIRTSDVCCRYGGEEFAILLPDTDLPAAVQVAGRLREEIYQARVQTRKGEVTVTASIGVATLDERTTTVEDLLHQADLALYAAKEGGRNCVRYMRSNSTARNG
jgi:diguanylate cyclase (GGDEF)-like protein